MRWGGSESTIREARKQVLDANGGVPPKVLDMFAGGGAIPLEATPARLRGDRGRAQPGRAPDRALHARLPAALRPVARGRRAHVGRAG